MVSSQQHTIDVRPAPGVAHPGPQGCLESWNQCCTYTGALGTVTGGIPSTLWSFTFHRLKSLWIADQVSWNIIDYTFTLMLNVW